jgi:hypothetical protein
MTVFLNREAEIMQERRAFRALSSADADMQLVVLCNTSCRISAARPATFPDECLTSSEDQEHVPTSESDECCEALDVEHIPTSSEDMPDPASEAENSHEAKRPRRAYRLRKQPYSCVFLGESVCKVALQTLLGIGAHRVQRIERNEQDLRKVCVKGNLGQSLRTPRKDAVFNSFLTFFWQLRCSVGEAMPNKFLLSRGTGGRLQCQVHVESSGFCGAQPPCFVDCDRNLRDPVTFQYKCFKAGGNQICQSNKIFANQTLVANQTNALAKNKFANQTKLKHAEPIELN